MAIPFPMEDTNGEQLWKVDFSSKARKQACKLPGDILDRLYALKLVLSRRGRSRRLGGIMAGLLASAMFIIVI